MTDYRSPPSMSRMWYNPDEVQSGQRRIVIPIQDAPFYVYVALHLFRHLVLINSYQRSTTTRLHRDRGAGAEREEGKEEREERTLAPHSEGRSRAVPRYLGDVSL